MTPLEDSQHLDVRRSFERPASRRTDMRVKWDAVRGEGEPVRQAQYDDVLLESPGQPARANEPVGRRFSVSEPAPDGESQSQVAADLLDDLIPALQEESPSDRPQVPPGSSGPPPRRRNLGEAPCPERDDLRKIGDITLELSPPQGEYPHECPLFADVYRPRCWQETTVMWTASSVCHKPLYFEDFTLERYGHSWGPLLQPFVSGAHFFATFPTLPYKIGLEHPTECIYPLGYYRPGDCAPKMLYQVPINLRAALYEAATVTGVIYLLP